MKIKMLWIFICLSQGGSGMTQQSSKAARCDHEGVLMPDPTDCHKFIQCGGGIPYTITCPDNLRFSFEKQVCDHPHNVKCFTTVVTTTTSRPPPVCQLGEVRPDADDPSSYFSCKEVCTSQWTQQRCSDPERPFFDEQLQTCWFNCTLEPKCNTSRWIAMDNPKGFISERLYKDKVSCFHYSFCFRRRQSTPAEELLFCRAMCPITEKGVKMAFSPLANDCVDNSGACVENA